MISAVDTVPFTHTTTSILDNQLYDFNFEILSIFSLPSVPDWTTTGPSL